VAVQSLARRRWVGTLLLAWALGLAQSQALVHRIVHAEHQHPDSSHAHHGAAPVHPADDGLHGPGFAEHGHVGDSGVSDWVLRLFGGHGDDTVCRLFDQSGHAASPPLPLLGALPVVGAVFVDFFKSALPAHRASLTQARGPPDFR